MPLAIDRDLTVDLVKSAVEYLPETGEFRWKVRRNSHTTPGKLAGSTNSNGYLEIGLFGVSRPCHRLAWAIVHGHFPDCEIDHRNGNKKDNRIANLRLASKVEQARNRFVRSDSKTGVKGVRFDQKKQRWVARITVAGKKKIIGRFHTMDAAREAYAFEAVKQFGPFARLEETGCASAT